MKRYAIIIERGPTSYGAYAPDVPGCIAVGETVEEVKREFRDALEFHLEGMQLDDEPIPEPTSLVDYVEVKVPEPAAKV